jgi:hypothetical protein
MNIEQSKSILETQLLVSKTPFGRPLTQKAISGIKSCMDDVKNYGNEAVQCEGCGMVASILITQTGCLNCGVEKFKTNIEV